MSNPSILCDGSSVQCPACGQDGCDVEENEEGEYRSHCDTCGSDMTITVEVSTDNW